MMTMLSMCSLRVLVSIIISIFAFSNFANAQQLIKKTIQEVSFLDIYSGVFLFSPEQALDMFEGKWLGSAQYYIGSDVVASYFLEQNYTKSNKSTFPRLISTGKVISNGNSIEIKGYMYVKNGLLYNDNINAQDGTVELYVAVIEDYTLVWLPKYLVSTYYIQTDNFSKGVDSVTMESTAYKHLIMPDKNVDTILRVQSNLTKSIVAKKDQNQSQKLSFPTSFKIN